MFGKKFGSVRWPKTRFGRPLGGRRAVTRAEAKERQTPRLQQRDVCSIQQGAGVSPATGNAGSDLIADVASAATGSRTDAAGESSPAADGQDCTELSARSAQQNGGGSPSPNFPNAASAFFPGGTSVERDASYSRS